MRRKIEDCSEHVINLVDFFAGLLRKVVEFDLLEEKEEKIEEGRKAA